MKNDLNKTVCIIGVFPPPIHGLSLINEAMKNLIISEDPLADLFDLSSKSLSRSASNKLTRLSKFIFVFLKFSLRSFQNKYHSLYIGLSGGLGQIYDLAILLVAHFAGQRIYIHHHTFSYLNKSKLLTKLILQTCGKNAINIVLCNKMRDQLSSYRTDLSIDVLSNTAFSALNNPVKMRNEPLKTIGFLGNISIQKGVDKFFDTLEILNKNQNINGIIAGSFQDKISKDLTLKRVKDNSSISYIGAIYDAKKEEFFNIIDVLLMPSILEEAEPLVIHEAQSFGIPVIAFNKGCISEIIDQKSGSVINTNSDFINEATTLLNYWIDDPNIFNQIRQNAYNNFLDNKKISSVTLEQLLLKITNKDHHNNVSGS